MAPLRYVLNQTVIFRLRSVDDAEGSKVWVACVGVEKYLNPDGGRESMIRMLTAYGDVEDLPEKTFAGGCATVRKSLPSGAAVVSFPPGFDPEQWTENPTQLNPAVRVAGKRESPGDEADGSASSLGEEEEEKTEGVHTDAMERMRLTQRSSARNPAGKGAAEHSIFTPAHSESEAYKKLQLLRKQMSDPGVQGKGAGGAGGGAALVPLPAPKDKPPPPAPAPPPATADPPEGTRKKLVFERIVRKAREPSPPGTPAWVKAHKALMADAVARVQVTPEWAKALRAQIVSKVEAGPPAPAPPGASHHTGGPGPLRVGPFAAQGGGQLAGLPSLAELVGQQATVRTGIKDPADEPEDPTSPGSSTEGAIPGTAKEMFGLFRQLIVGAVADAEKAKKETEEGDVLGSLAGESSKPLGAGIAGLSVKGTAAVALLRRENLKYPLKRWQHYRKRILEITGHENVELYLKDYTPIRHSTELSLHATLYLRLLKAVEEGDLKRAANLCVAGLLFAEQSARDDGKTSQAWLLTLEPPNPLLVSAKHDMPAKPGKSKLVDVLSPTIEEEVHTAVVAAECEHATLLEKRLKAVGKAN